MKEVKVQILIEMRNYLSRISQNPSAYRVNSSDFTRCGGKLGFMTLVVLIGRGLHKSLSHELSDFFRELGKEGQQASKSAFSQARQKLKAIFFMDWHKFVVDLYYELDKEHGHLKRWKGFVLVAVDGTSLRLPDKQALRSYFGEKANQSGSVCLARLVCIYDLLNGLSFRHLLAPYREGELGLFESLMPQLRPEMLVLADMYYASFELLWRMSKQDQAFVFRMKLTPKISQKFLKSKQNSQVLTWIPTPDMIRKLAKKGIDLGPSPQVKIRLLHTQIPGQPKPVVLVTSLLDAHTYPNEQLFELYRMRWAIESFYYHLKHQVYLQVFSGYSPRAIFQDTYAALLTTTVQAIGELPAQKIIDQQDICHRNTRKHKVNRNLAWGITRTYWIESVCKPGKDLARLVEKIVQEMAKHKEVFRPERKFPKDIKAFKNRRRNTTYLNHKTAA